MNAISISEADIQGYIDNEIGPDRRARVERYLADHPEEARRVRETRTDMALLRRYFTASEAHVPDRYIAETVDLVMSHAPSRQRRFAGLSGTLRVAAMVAFVVLGSMTVLGIKLSMTVPAFADAAALAYLDMARETAEDDEVNNPQSAIDWLNANTGVTARMPYSEEHGFHLSRARLTPFEDHLAGLLVYEDGRHHRVAIFVTRYANAANMQRRFAVDRSTYINYWSRNGVGVVIAAADKRDLEEFTSATEHLIDVASAERTEQPRPGPRAP